MRSRQVHQRCEDLQRLVAVTNIRALRVNILQTIRLPLYMHLRPSMLHSTVCLYYQQRTGTNLRKTCKWRGPLQGKGLVMNTSAYVKMSAYCVACVQLHPCLVTFPVHTAAKFLRPHIAHLFLRPHIAHIKASESHSITSIF